MSMGHFLHKGEALLLLALVLLGGVLLWLRGTAAPMPGRTALLTFSCGTEYRLPLQKSGVFTFTDGTLPVHIRIADGRACFTDPECPDHICEDFGWLSESGQTAICVPAGAWLQIP